jgi:hypothetical protein
MERKRGVLLVAKCGQPQSIRTRGTFLKENSNWRRTENCIGLVERRGKDGDVSEMETGPMNGNFDASPRTQISNLPAQLAVLSFELVHALFLFEEFVCYGIEGIPVHGNLSC